MKIKRKIIQIDEEKCDGCGVCVPSCAEGALKIVDGKVKLIAEKFCDGLGACLGECPQDALKVIEREADDFDEEAVEEHMKTSPAHKEEPIAMACGCPSANIQTFPSAGPCQKANEPASFGDSPSALTHWPVQIRLVPPTAPFLKGADLLVAADCTPVAYPNFHRDFLNGKVVMVGCPKFDDIQAYVQKFADIFKTAGVKSVEVVTMEVPCCQGLPVVVKKGMELAGKRIPLSQTIISTRGEVLRTQKLVA
ncbi:MAG TPA: 4Fe-4S binding protein [Thermodesulfobacteriota bacterium]|nr:4Fe-4S binding protein [Thermodesulfobacteriota bacterium]